MASPIEVWPDEALASQTMAQLAETIRKEDAAVNDALGSVILHAIRAGEALQEVKKRLGYGKWGEWIASEAPLSDSQIRLYIRLATYRDKVLAAGVPNLQEARALLAGSPASDPLIAPRNAARRSELKEMRAEGLSYRKIAASLGVSEGTIRTQLNPNRLKAKRDRDAQRRKQRRAEQRALREQEDRQRREAAIKQAGGDIAEVYSLLRKLTAAVDRAASGAADRSHTAALKAANHQLFKVEDEIVRIIGETS